MIGSAIHSSSSGGATLQSQNAQCRRKMTVDEEVIYSIVDQIKDPSWENIIFRSGGSDERVRGLKKIGLKLIQIN
jgi:hypothetical protein